MERRFPVPPSPSYATSEIEDEETAKESVVCVQEVTQIKEWLTDGTKDTGLT